MQVVRMAVLSCIFFSFLLTSICFADEAFIMDEINQLKERISSLEERLSVQDKVISEQKMCILEQDKKIVDYESRLTQFDTDLHRQKGTPIAIAQGLEISAGGTMIIQGTDNINNATSDVTKKEDRTDGSYSADIAIGKKFEEISAEAFLHLEAGQGAGLEDDLTLYSNVNRDADNDNNVRLTELWYEQAFLGDKAALTFGKLDPTAYFDNNEVANDETTQFLGRIFRNSPTIEFPDNTIGVRVAYMPLKWLELGYGLFDGNSDWEEIGDNFFNIGQIDFKTNFCGLAGNYRFLGWNNYSYHTKWLDTYKTKENNYGYGLSFDQKANDIITIFTRYGWQNPKVYNPSTLATGELNFSLTHSWSVGFQIEGKPWARENDFLAFAIGQAIPSKDYKEAGATLDPVRRAKTEGHIEAYYRIFINDHLSISPDFQYIWNPFGKNVTDDTKGIFIGGIRAQVDF